MLSDNATHTNRHLHVKGLPSKCAIKNRWSKELMMLVTRVLIGGTEGGLGAS